MKKRHIAFILLFIMAAALTPTAALAAQPAPEVLYFGDEPAGLLAEEDGTLIIVDSGANNVTALKAGKALTAAGKPGALDVNGDPQGGYKDSTAEDALFSSPWAAAPFLEGYAVTDSGNNSIRYIADGKVRTVAGNGEAGLVNRVGVNARFNDPTGIAADGKGNIYVADTGNNVIRKISDKGAVSTYAGQGNSSSAPGSFSRPTGLCWYEGALYIADTGNNRICKVVNGSVSVVAGLSSGAESDGGYKDGPVSRAEFSNPMGVCVGEDGALYVADTGNSAVRVISGGRVSTLYSVKDNPLAVFPVSPASVLLYNGGLAVSDVFSGNVFSIPTARVSPVCEDVAAAAWYAEPVANACRYGLFEGVSSESFDPDGCMNRGMFVTVLGRLAGVVEPNTVIGGKTEFKDVNKNCYYADSVAWAADNGLVDGKDDGLFAPNDMITRQEMAVLLYRFAVYSGGDTGIDKNATSSMPGADAVAYWAIDAMNWAAGKGILTGNEEGELRPGACTTRAETAKILESYLNTALL